MMPFAKYCTAESHCFSTGHRTPNYPFLDPHLIHGSLGQHPKNGILIYSAVFAGLTVVTNISTHTETDRPCYIMTSVATGCIYALSASNAALQIHISILQ